MRNEGKFQIGDYVRLIDNSDNRRYHTLHLKGSNNYQNFEDVQQIHDITSGFGDDFIVIQLHERNYTNEHALFLYRMELVQTGSQMRLPFKGGY